MNDTVPSFSAMLRQALGAHLRPDATSFVEMFAIDGVMEFPYAPAGVAETVHGRGALDRHLQGLSGSVEFASMGEPVVHTTSDPDLFILEYEGSIRGIVTNEFVEQHYISVIRVRGGQIVHYKDYWNPLVIMRALKGSETVDAFIGSSTSGG